MNLKINNLIGSSIFFFFSWCYGLWGGHHAVKKVAM